MKKALSIILALIMLLSLLPTAFAANTIVVNEGSNTVESGTGKWTFTDGELVICDPAITEVSISGDPDVTLSFASGVVPNNTFTVINSIQRLTVKPATYMPKGLRVIKNADYPVTVQFDPSRDSMIGNGLFIKPDGANITSISSEDVLVSSGKAVSILLTASTDAKCGDNAVAAINTTGSLKFSRIGSTPVRFDVTTYGPDTTIGGTKVCAINATGGNSKITVENGVSLNTVVNKKDTTDMYYALKADNTVIEESATISAKVSGGTDEINTVSFYSTWLTNSGTLNAFVNPGAEALFASYPEFKGGTVEATNEGSKDAAFFASISVAEGTQAIAGDSASTATAVANPDEPASYRGKKYMKIYIPVPGVTLDITTVSLTVGQTETLTATTDPVEATITDWTVPTADADKVTLTKNGKECSVKAEKAGTATITVTDSNGNYDTCVVTVTDAPASSISLNKTTLSIPLDGSFTLVATTDPVSATVGTEGWTKDNDNVSLTKDGKNCTVKGDKIGTSVVTVTDSNGNEESCTVTVTGAAGIDIYDPATDRYSLGSVGEVVRFRASVTPEWTAENNNDIRWTSSNENVAKVTAIEPHGKGAYIEATGAGSAAITASCGGRADVVSVVVVSDYKFTAPTGKLIWYYDRNPQYNLEFSTSIPYQGIRRVVIQAGNRDYDFTSVAMQNTYGTVTIPYSALYTTFGRQTTTMTVKVFYGPGANDYIYKNLYYRSVYDAPLTADTDMTWAYVTMLVAGLFISASPLILKKAKRRGVAQ